ncbi:hypothetical protein LTR97_006163 [Elasticomyces elasticus]|uniref:Uncharacterized protein n=1 Tax=Elasticomyces elasticus TaxID=574655 RepID=A0AAN7W966_9PEZI|nr:hypothetical protein LTR97_006163 [Elasticomyces elasticus]
MATQAIFLADPIVFPDSELPIPTIALFPLINTTSTGKAVVGVELYREHELIILGTDKSIQLVAAQDVIWNNAAFWIGEVALHTMGTDDLNAYSRFIHDENHPDMDIWTEMLEKYMTPEHAKLFRKAGLEKRAWYQRRFKRIPPDFMTNQNKTALHDFQGAKITPNHMRRDEDEEKPGRFPIPPFKQPETIEEWMARKTNPGAGCAWKPVRGGVGFGIGYDGGVSREATEIDRETLPRLRVTLDTSREWLHGPIGGGVASSAMLGGDGGKRGGGKRDGERVYVEDLPEGRKATTCKERFEAACGAADYAGLERPRLGQEFWWTPDVSSWFLQEPAVESGGEDDEDVSDELKGSSVTEGAEQESEKSTGTTEQASHDEYLKSVGMDEHSWKSLLDAADLAASEAKSKEKLDSSSTHFKKGEHKLPLDDPHWPETLFGDVTRRPAAIDEQWRAVHGDPDQPFEVVEGDDGVGRNGARIFENPLDKLLARAQGVTSKKSDSGRITDVTDELEGLSVEERAEQDEIEGDRVFGDDVFEHAVPVKDEQAEKK